MDGMRIASYSKHLAKVDGIAKIMYSRGGKLYANASPLESLRCPSGRRMGDMSGKVEKILVIMIALLSGCTMPDAITGAPGSGEQVACADKQIDPRDYFEPSGACKKHWVPVPVTVWVGMGDCENRYTRPIKTIVCMEADA